MIHLFRLHKRFGGTQALQDLNLNIEKGEFVFITGPSGAGKTTLLRLIFGAERPTGGQILVNGVNLGRISGNRLALLRRQIGFVFQDFKLIAARTVHQNVALALEVAGERGAFVRKRTNQALRAVGLAGKGGAFPLQLSGGEQQRVAIARAFVKNPLILLADEPTGNLDPDLAEEIMILFRSAHLRGTTVVIATHSRGILEGADKRVISLHHGRIQEAGQ